MAKKLTVSVEKWANFGILSATISIFFLPLIFGLLGIVGGALGLKQGAMRKGRVAIFMSIIFSITGIAINAYILFMNADPTMLTLVTNLLYVLVACIWVVWIVFSYRLAKEKQKDTTGAIIYTVLFGAVATAYYIFVLPEQLRK